MKLRLFGLVLALLVVLGVSIPAAAAPVAPSPVGAPSAAVVLYPQTALSNSGTVQSASPRLVRGVDVSRIGSAATVDIFATIDLASTGTVTITPQLAAGSSGWADLITPIDNGTAIASPARQLVLTADGTAYLGSLPLAGEKLRVNLQHTASVTATVWAVYRQAP